MNSPLNNITNLIENYNNLPVSGFEDSSIKGLKHLTYDTLLNTAGDLLYNENGIKVFSSLGIIAYHAISDFSYPKEKSEIILRLYFEGCYWTHEKGISSLLLEEFITNHITYFEKWQKDVFDDLHNNFEYRGELVSMFGQHFALSA